MAKADGLLVALAATLFASGAMAGDTSVGLTFTSDRDEQDVGTPQTTKAQVSISHAFDTGFVLGASVEYADTAFKDSSTVNIETTAGYRFRATDRISMTGSVGLGGRLQAVGIGDDFAYYVLRAGTDLKLTDVVTWNAIAFRYRDAFDSEENYLTPQLATGLTFKMDEHNSVSGKVQYNWKDWKPDTIGFVIGYGHAF
jgi:hypothetical protein